MRRRLLMGCGALLALLLVGGLTVWLLYGRIGAWAIREKVLPKMEARLGRELGVGSIEVGRGTVVLRDVVVPSADPSEEPLLKVDSVEVDFDYGASWTGDIALFELRAEGFTVHARRRPDGTSDVQDLVQHLRGGPETDSASSDSGAGRMQQARPERVRVGHGTVTLFDEGTGRKLSAIVDEGQADDGQDASLALSEVLIDSRAALRDLVVSVNPSAPLSSARVEIADGEVDLWPGMSLSGIAGTIEQGDTPEQLVIALAGSYGGATEPLWRADGWLDPREQRGQLSVVAERFTFDRIESVLRDSVVKDFKNTSVDAKLLIEVDDGKAEFSGRLNVSGLNLEHPKLAVERLSNMDFDVRLAASLDARARYVSVDSVTLLSKGVSYLLSGSYVGAGGQEPGGEVRTQPRLALHAQVPKTDCQAVLQSIPPAFVPKLQGFHLRGPFSADVSLVVDWEDLDGKTELGGIVDLPRCKVLSPSPEFDTERIQSSFEHQILVGPDEYETVEIGMESDSYAQIFDISPYFLNAVLTQEDSQFYEHHGFIPREFRSALVRNLQAGAFKFGASSISMQMVKNVFLSRDKTISRKLQELFLTWYVETTLDKNRILEIYANAIEYGPGVYGIVQASEIYFGEHPRDISPVEAAFLAQLLPSPRRRYFQYCKGKLSRRTSAKIGRILKNMHTRGRLTDDEYADATKATIEFNPQKVRELCRKQPNW